MRSTCMSSQTIRTTGCADEYLIIESRTFSFQKSECHFIYVQNGKETQQLISPITQAVEAVEAVNPVVAAAAM